MLLLGPNLLHAKAANKVLIANLAPQLVKYAGELLIIEEIDFL
jgi:hypothetical protein